MDSSILSPIGWKTGGRFQAGLEGPETSRIQDLAGRAPPSPPVRIPRKKKFPPLPPGGQSLPDEAPICFGAAESRRISALSPG